jgi:peptidyl-lysine (3S)-dioxygenase / protease
MKKSNILDTLSESTGDYWVSRRIPVLDNCTSVRFLKDAFSSYHPAILRGVVDHWPAMEKWTKEYLIEKLGEKKISVNLTSNGMADSVQDFVNEDGSISSSFVYPAEAKMTLAQFYELIESEENPTIIPYLSQQNDNLRKEYPELLEDIDYSLSIAKAAFENPVPEAVNLWIGDERSISSIHKDFFENFYVVMEGEKTFTLFPPTDSVFFEENEYPTLKFQLSLQEEEVSDIHSLDLLLTKENCPVEKLSWIAFDPEDPFVYEKYPTLTKAHPLRCTVQKGEILYIPAMWYHRVSQTRLTIAVNMWYDQRFDFRYVFFNTMQQLAIKEKLEENDTEK